MAALPNKLNLLDGLEALRAELSVATIAKLIERTAKWVSPETFRRLPAWYPEQARGQHFFKADWTEPQPNTKRGTDITIHKVEGNTYANKALTYALGLRPMERPNWSCCHIWGVDDPGFQKANHLISDARYYSCVANMVLLPTPLKAFTDVMPEIKAMLRLCSASLYDWKPSLEDGSLGHDSFENCFTVSDYPDSWPAKGKMSTPVGMVCLNDRILADIDRRKSRIRRDLEFAGPYYPRAQVQSVLEHWGIAV